MTASPRPPSPCWHQPRARYQMTRSGLLPGAHGSYSNKPVLSLLTLPAFPSPWKPQQRLLSHFFLAPSCPRPTLVFPPTPARRGPRGGQAPCSWEMWGATYLADLSALLYLQLATNTLFSNKSCAACSAVSNEALSVPAPGTVCPQAASRTPKDTPGSRQNRGALTV